VCQETNVVRRWKIHFHTPKGVTLLSIWPVRENIRCHNESQIPGQSLIGTGICVVLRYYAAWSCDSVPTIRDNLSVPPYRVKKSRTMLSIREELSYRPHWGGILKSRIWPVLFSDQSLFMALTFLYKPSINILTRLKSVQRIRIPFFWVEYVSHSVGHSRRFEGTLLPSMVRMSVDT
jgi:hypothetical protein